LGQLILGLCCLAFAAAPGRAAPESTPQKSAAPEAGSTVAAVAARIDQLIAAHWAERGVKPAPLADDAEFMRRAYLDLTGRIPRVSAVRAFLEGQSPDRRRRLVERLLESPGYVEHFSNVWRTVLLSEAVQRNQGEAASIQAWLKVQIRTNAPYDQMVREILTAPTPFGTAGPGAPAPVRGNGLAPTAFYQANEFKAENLASATSRIFLGVRLECAQCHDHPFASWKKTNFWEYAAFFAGVTPRRGVTGFAPGQEPLVKPRSIRMPGTDKFVEARFLSGQPPRWKPAIDSRVTLAQWVTAADNPYFARTAVNRIWAHFFGTGLNDPVDEEPNEANPVSHPDLLAELTREFIAHKYDVPFLIRAITASRTYQLTSTVTDPTQNEPRTFAHMAVKGLTAEQLFASLAEATGYREGTVNPQAGGFRPVSTRAEFLAKFASQDRPTEARTSILQALSLMNGRFIADSTSVERSTTLAAVADAPFLDTAGRIEVLYLATLTRPPRPEEAGRLIAYVNSGGPRRDERAALADVFWALLNSPEFILNH
jgi:hypothetical protein